MPCFPAAKLGDQIVSRRTYVIATLVEKSVLIEGRLAAVQGSGDSDKAQILGGSLTVWIGGKMAARATDPASTDKGPGNVVVASSKVLIG